MGSGSGGPSIKRLRVQNCAVKQCVAGPVPRSGVSPAGCDSKSEINLISKPEALRACVLLDLDPAEAITAGDPIRVHDFTNAPRGIWRERIHLPVRSLGTQEFLVVGSGPGDKIETLLGQPALKEAALSRSLLRIGDTCYPLRLWNWHCGTGTTGWMSYTCLVPLLHLLNLLLPVLCHLCTLTFMLKRCLSMCSKLGPALGEGCSLGPVLSFAGRASFPIL